MEKDYRVDLIPAASLARSQMIREKNLPAARMLRNIIRGLLGVTPHFPDKQTDYTLKEFINIELLENPKLINPN